MLQAELALHTREVRRLHEKLFYRPLLSAVARVPGEQPAARARRRPATGCGPWASPTPTARCGTSARSPAGSPGRRRCRSTCCRCCCRPSPSCPNPDAGLLAYRQVSEALGGNQWFLRLLRDEGQVAERLAQLLGSSQYVASLLTRTPEALRHPGRRRRARAAGGERAGRRLAAGGRPGRRPAGRHPGAARAAPPGAAAGRLRRPARPARRRPASGRRSPTSPSPRCRSGWTSPCGPTRWRPASTSPTCPMDLAVIGMGRLGGGEMGFGSDADVLFVHRAARGRRRGEGDGGRQRRGAHAAPAAQRARARPGVRGRRRPAARRAGRARWCAACRRSASTTSAGCRSGRCRRCCARCRSPATRSSGADFVALIDPIRYPAEGLTAEQVAEIRRIKARVERERLPRGADPATHTKLGRGGLSDVEWTVQLLQLQHAAEVPALRTASTVDGLAALRRRRAARRRADRGAAGGLGAGHPRPQRDLPGARAAQRPAAAPRRGAGGRGPGLRLRPGRGRRASSSRTTAAPPGGRGPWWSRSSTASRRAELPRVERLWRVASGRSLWSRSVPRAADGGHGERLRPVAGGPHVSHARPVARRRVPRHGAARRRRRRLGGRRHRRHRRVRCGVRVRPDAAGARLRDRPDLRLPHQSGGDPRRAALARDDGDRGGLLLGRPVRRRHRRGRRSCSC